MEAIDLDHDGILRPDLTGHLLTYLVEAVYLYSREGEMVARIAPPGGILGHGAEIGSNIYEQIHPDDLPSGIQLGSAIGASEPGWSGTFTMRLRRADGSWRPYQLRVFNRLGDPALDGIVVCIRERECADDDGNEVLDHEPLARSMAEAVPTASLVLDLRARIRHASPLAADLLGRSSAELFGVELADLAGGSERMVLRAATAAVLERPAERVAVFGLAGGRPDQVIEAHLRSSGVDHRSSLVTVVLTDRTDEPELVRRATRDPLTGLANRAQVIETLTGLLLQDPPRVSVLYCDLDRFKALNDAHGHETGDRALVAIAERLRSLVRPTDLVGRMGGDEFVIVCPNLPEQDAVSLASRLGKEVTVHDKGWELTVGLSAGAATAEPGDTSADVLRRADKRMFEAKRAGRLRSRPLSPRVRPVRATG